SSLSTLRSLSLDRCKFLTSSGIQCLFSSPSSSPSLLREISLRGCIKLDHSAFSALASSCPELESLDLSECPQVRDDDIAAITQGCPKLSRLLVQNCFR